MRKYLCSLLCLALWISCGMTAQAGEVSGDNYVDTIIAEKNAAQKETISEIDTLMKKRMQEQGQTGSSIASYDLSGAYQVYMMEPLFLTIYNETGSFASTITDTVQWKVPIKESGGENGLAVFSEGEDGLTFAGTVMGEAANTWMVSDEGIRTSVAQSKQIRSEIKKLQIAHSYMYQTTFVYLQNADGEYLIPYSVDADEVGIQNEKTYTVSELMKIFSKYYDEEQVVKNPNYNGGVPAHESRRMAPIICVVTVLVVGMGGGGLYYVIRKRRKS